MYNLDELWTSVLEELKVSMSSVSYRMYIEGIKPISIDGNVITLLIENESAFQILDLKYKGVIKDTIFSITKTDYDVVLISPNNSSGIEVPVVKPKVEKEQNGLDPKYTFDNFVVGKNNEFAYAGALSVAELPGKLNNPLFIYGGPGLGKTHIMHAIGNFIKQEDPDAYVMYVTSETFTVDFIRSIQTNKQQAFRDKYRQCDLLLIDDIQFLTKKEGTQEEFFHTFNTLIANGKQIVISSDRAPREIRDLEERLTSRFVGGLVADISRPDFETRVAILQKKVQEENLLVSQEVLHYIADVIKTNIRELEGSLKRVMAYAKLRGSDITLDITKEAFKDYYVDSKPSVITPKRIKEVVCEYMDITMEELLSNKRSKNIVFPRQISMYLIRTLTNLSYPQIAENEYGGMNHTTIMHNVEKIEDVMKKDEQTKIIIKDLINILNK